MKTPKKTTVKNPSPALDFPSYREVKSVSEITKDFLTAERQKTKNQGENSYIDDVGIALNMLVTNYSNQSWDLNTVVQLTRSLDTPIEAIAPIYFSWCEELKKHKRLKTLLSVSSFPTYAFQ